MSRVLAYILTLSLVPCFTSTVDTELVKLDDSSAVCAEGDEECNESTDETSLMRLAVKKKQIMTERVSSTVAGNSSRTQLKILVLSFNHGEAQMADSEKDVANREVSQVLAERIKAAKDPDIIMFASQEIRTAHDYRPLKKLAAATSYQSYTVVASTELSGATKSGKGAHHVSTCIEVAISRNFSPKKRIAKKVRHLNVFKRTKGMATIELQVGDVPLRLNSVHLETNNLLKNLRSIAKYVGKKEKQYKGKGLSRFTIIAGDYNSRIQKDSDNDCTSAEFIKAKFSANGNDARNGFFNRGRQNEALAILSKGSGLEGALPEPPSVMVGRNRYFVPTYKFPGGCGGCTPESVMGISWPGSAELQNGTGTVSCIIKHGDIGLGLLDYWTVLWDSDSFSADVGPLRWQGMSKSDHALVSGIVTARHN